MKFSLIVTLAASAGLLQVGAAPLRVIMISSNTEISDPGNLPFGHPPIPAPAPMWAAGPNIGRINTNHDGAHRRPCGRLSRGGRFRHKAIEISNFFRNALGLPLIKNPHHHPHHKPTPDDGKKFQMLPFIGTPPTFIEITNPGAKLEGKTRGSDAVRILPVMNPKFQNGHFIRPQKFSARLCQALMSLGKWEGRAVAFVLGCGIGVLIRMFFVLALIGFRSLKGGQKADGITLVDDNDHLYVILPTVEANADAKPVTTENHTYVDEKAPLDNVKTAEDQTK